ncbi:MAG: acetylornithine transaminase [Pseudomonadota bacterium]
MIAAPKPLEAPASSSALMAITSRPECVMVRGKGSYLWDSDGRQYLDFIQGWAVNALGHCPAELVSALSRQANLLISPSPALHNAPQLELADRLAEASGLAAVHFANSGAEANEAAVKLARKWGQLHKPGATQIITTTGGFHGRTLAMMAASGKPGWESMFPPAVPGFVKVPFGDADAVAAARHDDTLAIMVEPIQGEAGVVVPPDDYLPALRALADRHGLLLILDEVQTGIGRTGALFAHQHACVMPDIMTLGKGLGGGVPISALLASDAVSCFAFGDQGGTYNGNPLMTATAVAVLDTVNRPAFLANVRQRGAQMASGLGDLSQHHGHLGARGQGLLQALHLRAPRAADVAAACFERGLLINAAQPDIVRLMPSLKVKEAEVDAALLTLGEVLARLG